MKVYERLFSKGVGGMKFSYCGTQSRDINPATIKAVGQMFTYGDFVNRWFVITDDDPHFFKANEQPKAEQKWLNKTRRAIKAPRMTRDLVQAMPTITVRWMEPVRWFCSVCENEMPKAPTMSFNRGYCANCNANPEFVTERRP